MYTSVRHRDSMSECIYIYLGDRFQGGVAVFLSKE